MYGVMSILSAIIVCSVCYYLNKQFDKVIERREKDDG